MFESITFFNQNKTNPTAPLDIGSLVECMLFYQKTVIVANQSILRQLFTYFGVNRVIELIQEDLLQIEYTETNVGIHTSNINGNEYHDAIQFSSPQHTYAIELRKICIDLIGKEGKGKRTARSIENLIKVKNHEHIILEGARASILDQNYINHAVKSTIKSLIHETIDISGIEFNTEKTDSGISVVSNINFNALNQVYHKYIPPTHSTLSHAQILSHTLNVESELYFSSNNLSEIATSDLSSELISHKVNYVLNKSIKSSNEISEFQQFIFDDAKSLRDAVNNNQIDLDELIKVLKNSQKFKKWISGIDPDEDLIKKYYTEVTEKTFVEKLPGKTTRWGVFTGAGFVVDLVATGGAGTAIGLGLSALDAFYLDSLISGWKPNQYIEEEVKILLNEKT
ncbi:hypothetical protein MNBD_GAMMA11-2019 [hydrothermal vent metagenome]|uniref:Uncharacterized protein n=1 Tax=hydrothermal vent metagenome TaxID=652676 RepID=A0A3B0XCN9_9ZZZZ